MQIEKNINKKMKYYGLWRFSNSLKSPDFKPYEENKLINKRLEWHDNEIKISRIACYKTNRDLQGLAMDIIKSNINKNCFIRDFPYIVAAYYTDGGYVFSGSIEQTKRGPNAKYTYSILLFKPESPSKKVKELIDTQGILFLDNISQYLNFNDEKSVKVLDAIHYKRMYEIMYKQLMTNMLNEYKLKYLI